MHSDADAGLPYVREADHAVRLPGIAPADTYLRIDLLVDAAARAGADAVHPGYGFLSENADFARAVIDAGLTWIGPTPESIEAMGSKIEAKRIMREAGVPVLEAPDSPTEADLPLLVKASAGAAAAACASYAASPTWRPRSRPRRPRRCRRSATARSSSSRTSSAAATSRSRSSARTVLGERDCSIQRRHQKVVEEAPAPHLPADTRDAMYAAAQKAAEAIDYRGAGTVEFLVDAEDPSRFWFLEMNTRLQVEHPVTELVWGVDLVAMQLGEAAGSRSAEPATRSRSGCTPRTRPPTTSRSPAC